MEIEDQARLLALTKLSGIGDKRALKLLEVAGDLDSVYNSPVGTFSELHYFDEETHSALQALESEVEQYINRIEQAAEQDVRLLTPLDNDYPDRLRKYHSPLSLFIKGNEELLRADCISFAGSRDANENALNWTRKVSYDLAKEGYCIVSGGAFGVDKEAHRAALDVSGNTIIVSPSGHNNPYPGANSDIFEEAEERGLVVSHRFPDQKPARGGFLHRNKTNSALGSGIVIAAASEDGGSMAQYRFAVKQEKDVFIPDQEIGVEPGGGIDEMRSAQQVTTVKSHTEIVKSLSSKGSQQTLDSW